MANYNSLKSAIQEVIRTNGENEITGALLQQTLISIINSLGAGYQFIDVATPQTNPGTPDYNVVYIAFKTGIYSNFGGTELRPGEIGIFAYNGVWTYKTAFLLSSVFDLNNPETRKNGYELDSIGVYSENALYNSSGDMEIVPGGNYQTNYTGHIFCYGENGNFIEFVDAGDPLPNGTAFVRINWLATNPAPYFCSIENASLQTQILEISEKIDEEITKLKSLIFNLNAPETQIHGFELNHDGTIGPNADYTTSGFLSVNNARVYQTNYTGNIYCYDNSKQFLSAVVSGSPLPNGTAFVRLNWLSVNDAPYFFSLKESSIQAQIDKAFELIEIGEESIEEVYKVNGDDILGYEMNHDGTIGPNPDWRVCQFVTLESGKRYICNISGNYYYYDSNFAFLGRISTTAGTVFTNALFSGRAAYMRTNAPSSTEIKIIQVDAEGNPILNYTLFKGYAQNVLNGGAVVYDANVPISGSVNKDLPNTSANVTVKFRTNQSLYKQANAVTLFTFADVILVRVVPTQAEESYYCDKCSADIEVIVNGNTQTIPLRLNNFGHDLFSIRVKYPVVNVASDGETTMVTPMPSLLEGCYISKTDTNFTFYKNDNSVYKTFTLANYSDVDAFVEALKADSDITDFFEIVKFGCEGVAFSAINNFAKINLTKYVQEILYLQGNDTPTPTGNQYWDSYPTYIRTSDIGFEHALKFNYQVVNGFIKTVFVSLDGMFVRFTNLSIMTKITVKANLDGIVDSVDNLSIMPYERAITPMLSMQHVVDVSETLVNQDMHTSTMRQYDMLAYLRGKGFAGQNFSEAVDTITGTVSAKSLLYGLTFDDFPVHIWRNETIRNLFNQFRAKITLICLFAATDFDSALPPAHSPTKDEYNAIRKCGWDIISHGFCMYTSQLSYAQFQTGFARLKEKWSDWYNDEVCAYNPHGEEITDYQYYLLKQMGYNSICSGSAYLGWYCEAGTNIDLQYKRVTFMDSELNWDTVKQYIDNWLE